MILNPNFITIEGVDGAGKSTHVVKLVQQLKDLGYDVVHTREPGGTDLGENLRNIALHAPMSALTETMLMFASRNEHLEQVIRPALAAGKVVVCDRFTDSTWAYQGGGKGVPTSFLAAQEALVHGDLLPGLTLLFDLPVEVSLQRLVKTGKIPDKFEAEGMAFHQNVRDAYLKRAKDSRFKIVDSSKSVEVISQQVDQVLVSHLPKIHASRSVTPSRTGAPRA
jgi:dTMP kinase